MNRILVLFIAFCLSALSYGQNAETLREARAGNAAAQYRMANCYKFGWDGAEKNDEKYVYWLEKAANGGNTEASYDLGENYLYGMHGLPEDKEKYLKWCKKAAFNGKEVYDGKTQACLSLGLYYKNIDRQEAIYWLKKAMDTWWNKFKEENETYAENLRELGVHYHPGDKSTYSTSSNSSHSTNPSSNSNNSSSGHQQRQVWKERWRNCTACDPDRRGYCRNCHGRGGYYIGNIFNVCGICAGTGSCTMCGGRGEYKETYSTWE